MLNVNSARLRDETPHLGDALKRRAQSIINDKSIDAQTRVIVASPTKKEAGRLVQQHKASP